LLDLFGTPLKEHNPQSDDFFDLFEDTTASVAAKGVSTQSRNTVNALPIHPNLLNGYGSGQDPRASRSLQPDKLFDVSMWGNFDSQSQSKSNAPQTQTAQSQPQPQQAPTANARNTTLQFEPFGIGQQQSNDGDDEKQSASKKSAVRSSAPASTLKSSLATTRDSSSDEDEAEQPSNGGAQQARKPKETNALIELHRGAALLKYPRRSGFPHFKHIQLSGDNLRVEWFSKRKKLSATCIQVKDIREVVRGQETEVFKKFHQKTLEKSSFSVVYGASYKTLDLAAKSIDEAEMWVSCLLRLVAVYRQRKREEDLTALKEVFVGIVFKDRNRPSSRQGSGNFIRANSSKNLKIDPMALKEIERDMEALNKAYQKTSALAARAVITESNQYQNINYVLSELEERIEELKYEVANIRDTELAKREVWRANVDLSAIQEKVEVLLKHLGSRSSKADRRKSNFL